MTTKVFRDPAPETSTEPATGIRPRAQITRDELEELVKVRGLLCELRPGDARDPDGPLSWSPLARPPGHDEPRQGALARRIRVQTSVGPSEAPRDAFAAAAPLASGTLADERIRAIAAEGGEEPSRTLTWLQRAGTLVDGLAALYAAAGEAFADDARRARWAARPGALSDEQRRHRGREAVLYAARWWGGERPVCGASLADCAGRGATGTCVVAAASCARSARRVRGARRSGA